MATYQIIPSTTLKQTLSVLILGQKGGKNRVEIIELLRKRPYNVNQIAEKLDLNYRTVKHHIDTLLKYQLISSSKTGGYGDVYFLSPDLDENIHLYEGIVQKMETANKLADFTGSPLFFKNVLEDTYEGVIIVDNDWEVYFWNSSATRMFGYTNEEIMHGPLVIFSNRGTFSQIKKLIKKEKRLNNHETIGKKKSAELMNISITMDQIEDNEKRRIGYSMLIRDITDRKIADEALKKAEKEISRQMELAVLGQMAGGVGHELYNPLTSIKNAAYFLDMVLEGGNEVKETIGILKSETAEAERIIKTLLEFARKKTVNPSLIDINTSIQKALSRIKLPENIVTSTRLGKKIPRVLADPAQLEVIFGNVILNAIQAMPDGGTLTVGSRVSGRDSISIFIEDTGYGIPDEIIDKVFDPLFTTKPKGVGLGLAISRRFVEAHAGKIEVRNGKEKGCIVTITLPSRAEEDQ